RGTSATTRRPAAEKKRSSWGRPGLGGARPSALRSAGGLMRLDLPTLERPANAISTPCIGGSDSKDAAAVRNRHSAAKSLRPASASSALNAGVDIGRRQAFTAGPLLSGPFFFTNSDLTLSHSSILAPCFFMMMLCWVPESVLSHAQ